MERTLGPSTICWSLAGISATLPWANNGTNAKRCRFEIVDESIVALGLPLKAIGRAAQSIALAATLRLAWQGGLTLMAGHALICTSVRGNLEHSQN